MLGQNSLLTYPSLPILKSRRPLPEDVSRLSNQQDLVVVGGNEGVVHSDGWRLTVGGWWLAVNFSASDRTRQKLPFA